MIIKKLSVKSFGKLNNLDIDLAPGLNIVYGENESGKSTIQSFIKGIFYGLRKKSKKGEIPENERYLPWNGSEFAGMIEYEVGGKNYKAARNFATNKVSIYNELWDDVTDEFEVDKKTGPMFAEKHIGMNEDTFERTVFIRQLESRINESKDIVDRLMNLQQTGMEETSFRSAIEVLEGVIKDKIGSDKTSKRPINIINNEIERLLKDKYEVNLLRKEVSELEDKIRQKESEREVILERVEKLKSAKQSIKKESLLELYNKSKDYETSLEATENELARLKAFENFPSHLEDKLKEIQNDIKNFQQIVNGKKEYLHTIEEKLKAAEEQIGTGSDSELIYSILSDFQVMMDAVEEKDQYQKKLNELHGELDKLEENAKEFQNVYSLGEEDESQVIEFEKRQVELENKLRDFEKIKTDAEALDRQIKSVSAKVTMSNGKGSNGEFTFEDMEQILIKYRAYTDYRAKTSATQREIDKIKHDISVNDATLFDLEGFSNLPENIEEQVMKLYDRPSTASADSKYELDSLNAREKVFKYQFITNALLTVISLGLIAYGVFGIVTSRGIVPITVGAIGLIILAFSSIKLVGTLSGTRKIRNQKSELLNSIPEEKGTEENIENLNEIYQSVGAQDFTSFMKKLYSYKDASHKIQLLNLDLGLKKQYLESIKDQMSGIQQEISEILNYLGIMHDPSSITDMDILNLKDKFNRLAINGHLDEETNYIGDIDRNKEELLGELRRITGNESAELDHAAVIYEGVKEQLESVKRSIKEIYDRLNISDGTQLINKVKDGFEKKKEVELKKYEIGQLQDTVYKLIEKVVNIDHKIKMALSDHSIEFHEEALVNETHIEELKGKLSASLKTTEEISNLRTLKDNVSSDIAEIEEELKGAENEKSAILEEAMVNDEQEFFEGCRNFKRVKELLDEKARLMNILDELLKGEDTQSLLEKIASIEEKDVYAGQIDSLEDADVQIDGYKREIERLNEEVINLRNDASNKLSGKAELNEIVEQLEYLQDKKLELESLKQSVQIAVDVLNEAAKQMQQDFAPRLQNEISKVIKQITAGKYSEVKANEKLNLNVLDPQAGQIVNIEKLSMGTIEQFYLSLRIALSNVLGDGSERLPIIIDEAFVQYDDIRMLNVLEFLAEISAFRQVIIFTCQSREIEAVKRIENNTVNIVELAAI